MDDEHLINQVKEFPALYNKKDSRYKSKLAKENAWKTIAAILESDVVSCEQRWTSLRAKYTTIRKKLREMPSGSGSADIPCFWPYYHMLSFLDPFLLTRRTVSNFKPSMQPISSAWDTLTQVLEGTREEPEHSESDDFLTPLPSPREESLAAPTPQQARIQKTASASPHVELEAKKRKTETVQDELCNKMSSCIDTLNANMGQKPSDREFALSLAQDMSVLTSEEKIFFKRNAYMLLTEILEKRH
ncbi:unnamed protein product [Ceutorhynchus assimilis]|uniref:MADF domain-containing protein n=1 Tax=Ceutorhynchus assimilis TaxID=467358 RepID=A0A9N9MY13_9CUCU|nr:unnamed protein product [Ceutorhynchus assimilis]